MTFEFEFRFSSSWPSVNTAHPLFIVYILHENIKRGEREIRLFNGGCGLYNFEVEARARVWFSLKKGKKWIDIQKVRLNNYQTGFFKKK